MEPSHGADADRLEGVGRGLLAQAQALSDVRAGGTSSFGLLQEGWQGPDLERFHAEWQGASYHLDGAEGRIREFSEELLRQAEQQRGASAAGSGPGGSSGGSDVAQPDNNDERDIRWWYPAPLVHWILRRRADGTYDNKDDPGPGNVDLPRGADRDDPVIQEMLETAEGRAALDWMERNGITLVTNDKIDGGYYSPSSNTMYMHTDYWNASTIIHEAEHAQQDAEDRSPDITNTSREEYVDGMIGMEAEAQTAEAHYWREVVENDPSRAGDMPPRYVEYWRIYNETIDAGGTPEEAAARGHEYHKEEVRDLKPSTYEPHEDKDYEDYYGESWDNAN